MFGETPFTFLSLSDVVVMRICWYGRHLDHLHWVCSGVVFPNMRTYEGGVVWRAYGKCHIELAARDM